jgi:hypothetical protein
MEHALLVEKYEAIREQLHRFKGRLRQVEGGEHIYARKPGEDDLIEITPNVLARYRSMISICEFAIQLIEDHHLTDADAARIASSSKQGDP